MLTGIYYKIYTYYNRQAISVQHRTKERNLIRYVQDSDFVLVGIDNTNVGQYIWYAVTLTKQSLNIAAPYWIT